MWTAPFSQVFWQCFDTIACVHMSGLLLRFIDAGQDGFRDRGSKQQVGFQLPQGGTEYPLSWIDRSHHLLSSCKFWHRPVMGIEEARNRQISKLLQPLLTAV